MPALLEARRLWQELENVSGRQVLLPVGALSIGPNGHPDLASTMPSIDSYGLPHRVLDAAELREHYPQFAVRHDDVGILDELGGGRRPEAAVMTATASEVASGAEVRHHTEVVDLRETGDSVTTSTGTIRPRRVVVTAGSWTTRLLPELADLVHVEAYALTWFLPRRMKLFGPDRLPVFMRDLDGVHAFGAPSLDGYSIKMCPHLTWPPIEHPSQVPDQLTADQLRWAGEQAQRMMPDLVPDPVRWSIHHDSVTADHMPIIDTVGAGRIVVATGMSGNGFKFAPAYGQVLAELATDAEAPLRHPMFTIAGHHRRTAEAA